MTLYINFVWVAKSHLIYKLNSHDIEILHNVIINQRCALIIIVLIEFKLNASGECCLSHAGLQYWVISS